MFISDFVKWILMNFRVVFARVIKHIFIAFGVCSQLTDANVVVSISLILLHRDQVICSLVECAFFRVKHQHPPSRVLFQEYVIGGVEPVQARSMARYGESQLT